MRVAFVDITVTELTVVCAVAVGDAGYQALTSDSGWIAGTQAYLSDLETIATMVKGGAEVQT